MGPYGRVGYNLPHPRIHCVELSGILLGQVATQKAMCRPPAVKLSTMNSGSTETKAEQGLQNFLKEGTARSSSFALTAWKTARPEFSSD
eukprot:1920856-Amphidinium_carterae.1